MITGSTGTQVMSVPREEKGLMPATGLPGRLKNILAQNVSRDAKAARIAEAIHDEGSHRWAGIYDVDLGR
jgi:hypothetical protein